ncbi:MAG: hypothetical protein LUE26_07045 [Alistipes sp.]|nr:hypothetical protein [Alistipes sp.]
MKTNISKYPELQNAVIIPYADLIFIDKQINLYYIKQLMFSGVNLQIKMGNNEKLPTATIAIPKHLQEQLKGGNAVLILTPEMENFLLNYLMHGDFSNPPEYRNEKIYWSFNGDYNLFHLKKEKDKGLTRAKKSKQNRKDGYIYYANYPYGTIEYGFYPFSPSYMKILLDNLDSTNL